MPAARARASAEVNAARGAATGGARPLQKAQIDIRIKEELRNSAGGAGIDLALQVIQIGLAAG